jgi:cold-inducible RNA-binding protein
LIGSRVRPDSKLSPEGHYFMSIKLFVRDLSPGITGDELRELLSEVGGVESCKLMSSRDTGRSKGFGFIEMNSKEAAEAVTQRFNGQDPWGQVRR